MASKYVEIESGLNIQQLLEAERMHLREIPGLDQPSHSHRPVERSFAAEEGSAAILFGGFSWKHEDLIRAGLQGFGSARYGKLWRFDC